MLGAPRELTRQADAASLEDAFISYLEEAENASSPRSEPKTSATGEATPKPSSTIVPPGAGVNLQGSLLSWLSRTWAFAWREALELQRDKLRIAFALLGPAVLLFANAYSVSFDVENVRFSVFDQDRSVLSREFFEHFSGSHYFVEEPEVHNQTEAMSALRSASSLLVIEMPPNFGRDLVEGRRPEVGFFVEASAPFNGLNIRSYITGVVLKYTSALMRSQDATLLLSRDTTAASPPISVEQRFAYNQEFKSIYAITPGTIMLTLILIPAMLTALGVVREKEIGSIINLYASPATIGQFLIGKQLPYVGVAMLSYLTLFLLSVFVIGVPLKGSFLALSIGVLFYLFAVTAFGLLISAFVKSQVAAIFGTANLMPDPFHKLFRAPLSRVHPDRRQLLDGNVLSGLMVPADMPWLLY